MLVKAVILLVPRPPPLVQGSLGVQARPRPEIPETCPASAASPSGLVASGPEGYRFWFGRNVTSKKSAFLTHLLILPRCLEVFGTQVQGELIQPRASSKREERNSAWASACHPAGG